MPRSLFAAVLIPIMASCGAVPRSPAPPPAAARDEAPAPRSFADFRPSIHGFAFVNRFPGAGLPVALGPAEQRLGLPDHYGLCGGMCAAAADYFLARRAIPGDSSPPPRGTPLHASLYSRQAASLGPLGIMVPRFVEWMRLPDDGPGGTRARTREELPEIEAALSRGQPVFLGLVLVSARTTREPWHNHQVLAYGLEPRAGGLDLRVYDPNFPARDDAVIRIEPRDGLPVCTRIVPGQRPTPVRGLFRMPYAPADPG